MFIGYFTESPYQDEQSDYFGPDARPLDDLNLTNEFYSPRVAADLYHRYLDEKLYAEEVGFDGVCLNEHHSTPFCMRGAMNIEAGILARITQRVKIVLIGNILPIWEDPLWLAEELAIIDTLSRGRLVTGWVRGGGRESITHNAQPPYNWERFQEGLDFIIKAWTTPGPFRWEGQHFQYRYVNPWAVPWQKPHPPVWIPGIISKRTVKWAAERRYPYVMLATDVEATKQSFDYYREVARETGYEAGPEQIAYLMKVHVDETEELADRTARKLVQGFSNPFLEGNKGTVRSYVMELPGMTDKRNLLPTAATGKAIAERSSTAERTTGRGLAQPQFGTYEDQIERMAIITGTPKTVIPKLRHVLERIRPGSLIFWDGDGAMTHDDAMRSIRLFGQDVIPALREISNELGLRGPFDPELANAQAGLYGSSGS
jgi:alkanesulfonate monooxygenase SsuD/methylene tetrahydromethanopterin reductase-like flavin-dependent oxidoreductase (luciferase family)